MLFTLVQRQRRYVWGQRRHFACLSVIPDAVVVPEDLLDVCIQAAALFTAPLILPEAALPEAALPEVVQLMWVHIEEPDPDGEVLDPSGIHIWYRVGLRNMSGSVLLGIPQRCATVPAGS